MSSLFVSDLHLSETSPAVAQAWQGFLDNRAADASALYILGDFFDAWIGDDDDSAFVETITQSLRDYTASGREVWFMHGNRDFLIGENWAADAGVGLLRDPHVMNLYGRRALLMHGDSLCTRDREYQAFREQVRSPQWQQQVLSLPLPQRRQMAADLRRKSRSLSAVKAEDIMDVTPSEVERVMSEQRVDLLIHGHTHRPARHPLQLPSGPAERIVLGDWHHSGWYLEADPEQMTLHSFDLESGVAD